MTKSWLSEIVSRETIERLEIFEKLLKKWNPAINLVAKSSLKNAWERHIIDSAQLYFHVDQSPRSWLDIGSGGGFPGLVCAIIAKELNPDCKFTLIESDQRKCVFLRTVARETGISVTILSERIEKCDSIDADVLTARALASLSGLLEFAEHHLSPSGHAFFMKGARYRDEITEALENWTFIYDKYDSRTDNEAVIIKVGDLKRV